MSRAEPKPAGRRAGMRRLLEASWQTLWNVLEPRMPGVVVEALAPAAKDDDPQVAKPAKQVMARDRRLCAEYERALKAEYQQAIEDFIGARPEGKPPAAGGRDKDGEAKGLGAGLALVDYGDMEMRTLVEASASRLRNAADDIYGSLCTRLANAVREPEIRAGESPFRPAMFFRALHAALTRLDALSADQVLVLMPHFDGPLAKPVIDAYAAIDEQLSARGHGNELVRASILRNSIIGRTTRQGGGTQDGGQGGGGIGGAKAEQILQALYNRLQLVPEGQPAPAVASAPAGTTLVAVPAQAAMAAQVAMPMQVAVPAQGGIDAAAGLQSGAAAVPAAGTAAAGAAVAMAPTVALPGAPMAIGADLLNAINEIQKLGALALSAVQLGQPAPDAAIETSELRRRLMDRTADQVDRLTIEIVGLLFERINADRHVPQPIKDLLQRLQFPLIKVAVTDPSLFVRTDQPARQLMDRIASTAIGWTGEGEANARYLAEVQKAVHTVLAATEEGIGAFARALEQFETFLGDERTRDDDPVQRAKRALAEAEEREIMAINATIRIRSAFEGVQVESYLRDFLLETWPRVLVAATVNSNGDAGTMRRYLGIVPDLVWSVQPKLSQEDRKRLVGTIPPVLGLLREGLLLVEWPKERMQEFFGKLMNSHAQAVKALELAHGSPGVPFEPSTMRIKLDGIGFDEISAPPPPAEPMKVSDEQVRQVLQHAQADVEHLMPPSTMVEVPASTAPQEAAAVDQRIAAFKRGDWFNLRLGDVIERVQLRWISPRKTLYLFMPAERRSGHSLSPETLRAYLRNGDLTPVEAEPLFGRAVHDVVQELQRSATEPAAQA